MKITTTIIGFLAILVFVGCDSQLDALRPHNVTFEDRQFQTPEGYTQALWGVYALSAGAATPTNLFNYNDIQLFLSEVRGNTIKSLDALVNRNTDAFNYVNSAGRDFSHTYDYWRASYTVPLHINKLLANVAEDETRPVVLQAKAEALYLRAHTYFNLVRLYGRPYYQQAGQSPGVMLITNADNGPSFAPSRATVASVYQQVIADLQASLPLFTQAKTSSFASKYAAYALLSRVYLYMGGTFADPGQAANEQAYAYADTVIRYGGYQLLQDEAYQTYYETDNIGNAEDIFAINTRSHRGYISGLYAMPTQINYSGGLYRPSPYLLALLDEGDLRHSFFVTNVTPGFPEDTKASAKYLINYVSVSGSSPWRYLRLAEMYLNRAEAAAKLGRDVQALTDVNTIRVRAHIDPVSGLSGQALFDEVIRQRRLELCFEGHASFDDYRNGRAMVRDYASGGSGLLTVSPTDANVVLKVPDEELTANPNLIQNN